MVSYGERPVFKTSPGKETIPYKKQIHRVIDQRGLFKKDIITLENDQPAELNTEPLLQTYVKNGNMQKELPSINQIRDTFDQDFYRLGENYKNLDTKEIYPVVLRDRLSEMYNSVRNPV